ncbi:MAG: PilZ domain-containing protein [Omnitrophica bacterium]|nr:PilZ domain-containing protein [Candidatus Omnitrophota bacterium]
MPDSEVGKERRVFERVLARCPVKVKIEEERELIEGSSKDLSDGGLGLFTHSRIGQDTHLEMWIKIAAQLKPLHIGGKVAWAQKRRPDLWRAGVCFDEMAFIKIVKILVGKSLN